MNGGMPKRRRLLTVEDTFFIAGRGLIVAPDVDLGQQMQQRVLVELHRPDGSAFWAEALAQVPFVCPPQPGIRPHHTLLFTSLTKQDVPVGTEVWMGEET
jgi:hypothetical protein